MLVRHDSSVITVYPRYYGRGIESGKRTSDFVHGVFHLCRQILGRQICYGIVCAENFAGGYPILIAFSCASAKSECHK